MPEEAPVTSAVPLPLPLLISFLHPPSDLGVRRSFGLEEKCLKRHINGVLGHSCEEEMRRIGIVLFPGFQVMSLAMLSAFEFANLAAPEPAYDISVLAETGGPVRSAVGMTAIAEALDDRALDTLIVVGGTKIEPT